MSQELGESFQKSMLQSKMIKLSEGLLEDSSELILDNNLTDGILKEIPIFKYLYATGRLLLSFRELQNLKKIVRFLTKIDDLDESEKEAFFEKLECEGEAAKLSERLLIIIDRLDQIDKSEMLANAFKFYVRGGINQSVFLRIAYLIESCFINDLIVLVNYRGHNSIDIDDDDNYKPSEYYNSSTQDHLLALGILKDKISIIKKEIPGFQTNHMNEQILDHKVELTDIGRLLAIVIRYNDDQYQSILVEYWATFQELNA